MSLSLEPEKAFTAPLAAAMAATLLRPPCWSLDPHAPTVLEGGDGC